MGHGLRHFGWVDVTGSGPIMLTPLPGAGIHELRTGH
jgi:hypothetical protein